MDSLATGVLRSPHGLLGYMKMHSFSTQYSHLEHVEEAVLRKDGQEKPVAIQDVKVSGQTLMIKFRGIDDPESAKLLNGWELWIPRSAAAPLEEGEVYVADLIGCAVLSEGVQVGTVVSTIDGAQALLLEVQGVGDGQCHLVPYMERFVGQVDVESKKIELLELMLLT